MKKLQQRRLKTQVSLNLKTRESVMKIAKVMFALGQVVVLTSALAQTASPTPAPPAQAAAPATRPNFAQLPSTQVTPNVAAQLNVSQNVRRGGESGGGGSYVLIDGEIMISDRFYDSIGNIQPTPVRQVTFAQLPQAVKRGAVGLINFFQRATKAKRGANEAITNIFNGQYFLVPKGLEHQAFCNNYLPNLNRQVDEHFRFGCTNGNVTFLFIDAFERPEVGLREQVYALLHERLWTLVPGIDQSVIANFTTALHDLEDLSVEQENNPQYYANTQELSAFTRLQGAAQQLGYSTLSLSNYNVHATGGLINKQCGRVDLSQALFTAGSRMECLNGRVPALRNSKIVRSLVKETGTIENSTIVDSSVQTNDYYDDREMTQSNIRWLLRFPFTIKDSSIQRSSLYGANVVGAQITNVTALTALIGQSFSLSDSNIRSNSDVQIGAGSQLTNVRIRASVHRNMENTAGGKVTFKAGSQIDGLVFESQLQNFNGGSVVGQLLGRGPEMFGVEFGPAGTLRRRNQSNYTDASGNTVEYAVDPGVEITKGPNS